MLFNIVMQAHKVSYVAWCISKQAALSLEVNVLLFGILLDIPSPEAEDHLVDSDWQNFQLMLLLSQLYEHVWIGLPCLWWTAENKDTWTWVDAPSKKSQKRILSSEIQWNIDEQGFMPCMLWGHPFPHLTASDRRHWMNRTRPPNKETCMSLNTPNKSWMRCVHKTVSSTNDIHFLYTCNITRTCWILHCRVSSSIAESLPFCVKRANLQPLYRMWILQIIFLGQLWMTETLSYKMQTKNNLNRMIIVLDGISYFPLEDLLDMALSKSSWYFFTLSWFDTKLGKKRRHIHKKDWADANHLTSNCWTVPSSLPDQKRFASVGSTSTACT